MEINKINKELYELAFIQNGEFGYHENNWKPSINENEIDTMCENEDGIYVPATPLGYRDYKKSRAQGLQNIFDQYPSVDLTNDKYHHIKRNSGEIKLYDKIKVDVNDEIKEFIVIGDVEDMYFVVSAEDKLYSIAYEK